MGGADVLLARKTLQFLFLTPFLVFICQLFLVLSVAFHLNVLSINLEYFLLLENHSRFSTECSKPQMALVSDLAKNTLKLRQTHFPRGGFLEPCKLCAQEMSCSRWSRAMWMLWEAVGLPELLSSTLLSSSPPSCSKKWAWNVLRKNLQLDHSVSNPAHYFPIKMCCVRETTGFSPWFCWHTKRWITWNIIEFLSKNWFLVLFEPPLAQHCVSERQNSKEMETRKEEIIVKKFKYFADHENIKSVIRGGGRMKR